MANYSELGIATARIANRIICSTGNASNILAKTIYDGRPSFSDQDILKTVVNIDRAQSLAPNWLNVTALLEETMRINSPLIWTEVFRRANIDEPDAVRAILDATGELTYNNR